MKVLVACEFSGIVRDAFIELGHDAVSCDLLPTEKPGEHYQGDVRDILKGHSKAERWDLMIAHPPCTHLCVSGQRWFNQKSKYAKPLYLREEALDFVRLLLDAPIEKIALENPISIISTHIRKPDQIIQPFHFGEDSTKKTCLWLKNLPKLNPTEVITPSIHISKSGRKWDKWFFDTSLISDLEERSRVRSLTFPKIAKAMAERWGEIE